MRNLFIDSWGCLRGWVIALAMIVACVVVPVGGLLWADAHDCGVYSRVTGRVTSWEFGTCYVNVSGKLIPKSEFNARAITNEVAE